MGLYGSTPKAPDPNETAGAQFNYDTGASLASGIINNPNTYDPYGQTIYSQAGMETITLPNGQKVQVPRYNKKTSLTPQGQKILNQQQALAGKTYGNLSGMMGKSSTAGAVPWQTGYDVGKLKTGFQGDTGSQSYYNPAVNRNMNLKGSADTTAYSGLLNGYGLKQSAGTGSFNPLTGMANDVQTSYADPEDFEKSRERVERASMSRGNKLLQEGRNSETARLAAMGLAPGTEAYGRVADQFERSSNDLAMQAVLAGGQEQSRMLGEARSAGQFYNQATGQRFGQRMGLTEAENARRMAETGLFNQTEQQMFDTRFGTRQAENERRMAETGIFNEAQQGEFAMRTSLRQMENARRTGDMQAYNQALESYNNAQLGQTQMNRDRAGFGNQVRSGQIGERESLKSNELNRLISLLTGGQVQSPTIPGYNTQGVSAPDYSGLVQNQYASQVGQHNNQMSAISGLLGGFGSLFM